MPEGRANKAANPVLGLAVLNRSSLLGTLFGSGMGKVARKVPAPAGTGTAITWRALY